MNHKEFFILIKLNHHASHFSSRLFVFDAGQNTPKILDVRDESERESYSGKYLTFNEMMFTLRGMFMKFTIAHQKNKIKILFLRY